MRPGPRAGTAPAPESLPAKFCGRNLRATWRPSLVSSLRRPRPCRPCRAWRGCGSARWFGQSWWIRTGGLHVRGGLRASQRRVARRVETVVSRSISGMVTSLKLSLYRAISRSVAATVWERSSPSCLWLPSWRRMMSPHGSVSQLFVRPHPMSARYESPANAASPLSCERHGLGLDAHSSDAVRTKSCETDPWRDIISPPRWQPQAAWLDRSHTVAATDRLIARYKESFKLVTIRKMLLETTVRPAPGYAA